MGSKVDRVVQTCYLLIMYIFLMTLLAPGVCIEGDLSIYDSYANDHFLLDYPEAAQVGIGCDLTYSDYIYLLQGPVYIKKHF